MNYHLYKPFWILFYTLVLVAWAVMFWMSLGMGAMIPSQFSSLFVMWSIMMAAMMGPTFVPTMRAYEDLIVSADGSRLGSIGLVSGFFAIWFGFAGLLAFLQLNLTNAGLITSMGQSVSTLFSVIILFSAGAYQFTQLKDRCLSHCRSPMMQFIQHWKPGVLGGVNMGLHHGAFCVACCWGLMAIGFVGGIMDLRWMGGATILMTLEKLPDIGRRVTKPIGIGLILWGIVLAAT